MSLHTTVKIFVILVGAPWSWQRWDVFEVAGMRWGLHCRAGSSFAVWSMPNPCFLILSLKMLILFDSPWSWQGRWERCTAKLKMHRRGSSSAFLLYRMHRWCTCGVHLGEIARKVQCCVSHAREEQQTKSYRFFNEIESNVHCFFKCSCEICNCSQNEV